ncbi:MAG: hypothetical protein DWQ05_19465 [Calditrichaeota bacterium]|nr:MAG: hypothetical protein DWQ05_19465 [Calditrichota bacterium]
MEISIQKNADQNHHPCNSIRHGDWVVFKCPLCPDYERRINWRTKEVSVKGSTPEILHNGEHLPDEYLHALTATN